VICDVIERVIRFKNPFQKVKSDPPMYVRWRIVRKRENNGFALDRLRPLRTVSSFLYVCAIPVYWNVISACSLDSVNEIRLLSLSPFGDLRCSDASYDRIGSSHEEHM
jgi:hypothetical protein